MNRQAEAGRTLGLQKLQRELWRRAGKRRFADVRQLQVRQLAAQGPAHQVHRADSLPQQPHRQQRDRQYGIRRENLYAKLKVHCIQRPAHQVHRADRLPQQPHRQQRNCQDCVRRERLYAK